MEINKYHNSKIYKLVSDHTDKIYIGSTVQPLYKRKAGHKQSYTLFKKNKYSYITSYELIELGEIDIILIENVKCESKEELHAKERYYIELNKEKCVNMVIPTRTNKEWYDDNKEYNKNYYKNNIEIIKEKHNEYYENNKEILKTNMKEYRLNNKEIISEKSKEQFNCECGGKFIKSNKIRHLNSKKHFDFLDDFFIRDLNNKILIIK
jgi:hypothetical protein